MMILNSDYAVRIMDLPDGVKAMVMFDENDFANIYISAHLNREQQREAFRHELIHIVEDDIHNDDDIHTIEARASRQAKPIKSFPNLIKASALLPKPEPPAKQAPNLTDRQIRILQTAIAELDRGFFSVPAF